MSFVKVVVIMIACAVSLNGAAQSKEQSGADRVPEGQELVSIDFPEPTDIKDIIRAVALWTGKNVILGKGVNGKVQMISPRKVTKEEAYQAFLSALNVLGLTTVETGKVIKILPTRNALKGNLRIYQGTTWAPRTDKLITQIVPLKYIDAKQIQTTLSRIVSTNSMIAYQPTNTLIISDTGYKVGRILQIVELLDVARQQPKVALVPIKYGDAKNISAKVSEILKASQTRTSKGGKASYRTYKITVDERSNSVVIFGPPRTIQDVKDLVKKFDFPIDDPTNQAAIRVRFLDYADAKKLATTLSSLAQGSNNNNRNRTIGRVRRSTTSKNGALSSNTAAPVADLGDNVKITADESANALLITGSRSAYEAINSIVRKLDRRRAQVYVEADILDVKLTNTLSFGTSIIFGSKNGNAVQSYGWQGGNMAPIVAAGTGDNTSLDQAAKIGIAQALGQDFTIGVLSASPVSLPGIGDVTPGGLISMLKADGNTRVLASPHLLTSNNESAKITVGNKIFYRTVKQSAVAGGAAIPEVKDVDADLELELKPNVNHSGSYVTLKLDLEASEGTLDPTSRLPSISKRKTSQLVTVRNGQTAVISGLVKRRDEESFQKIPLLGDIPILGWLFRNSRIIKETTSLMIFLTPNVVFGANDLASIYKKKVEQRDTMLKAAYGFDENDEFYQSLPTQQDGAYEPTAIDEMDEQERAKFLEDIREDMRGPQKPGSQGGLNPFSQPTPIPMPPDEALSNESPAVSTPTPPAPETPASPVSEEDSEEL